MIIKSNIKNQSLYLCFILPVIVLTGGCAGLKETAKGILGVSTKELDKNRPGAVKEVFNCGYKICYDKTIEILKQIGAYIYLKDEKNKFIAIYISKTDTTSVGLYFSEYEAVGTRIEISSASKYAKELISRKLFSGLEGFSRKPQTK